jgi:hypothetical protein
MAFGFAWSSGFIGDRESDIVNIHVFTIPFFHGRGPFDEFHNVQCKTGGLIAAT